MDNYDLFNEDLGVGGSMLESLTALGETDPTMLGGTGTNQATPVPDGPPSTTNRGPPTSGPGPPPTYSNLDSGVPGSGYPPQSMYPGSSSQQQQYGAYPSPHYEQVEEQKSGGPRMGYNQAYSQGYGADGSGYGPPPSSFPPGASYGGSAGGMPPNPMMNRQMQHQQSWNGPPGVPVSSSQYPPSSGMGYTSGNERSMPTSSANVPNMSGSTPPGIPPGYGTPAGVPPSQPPSQMHPSQRAPFPTNSAMGSYGPPSMPGSDSRSGYDPYGAMGMRHHQPGSQHQHSMHSGGSMPTGGGSAGPMGGFYGPGPSVAVPPHPQGGFPRGPPMSMPGAQQPQPPVEPPQPAKKPRAKRISKKQQELAARQQAAMAAAQQAQQQAQHQAGHGPPSGPQGFPGQQPQGEYPQMRTGPAGPAPHQPGMYPQSQMGYMQGSGTPAPAPYGASPGSMGYPSGMGQQQQFGSPQQQQQRMYRPPQPQGMPPGYQGQGSGPPPGSVGPGGGPPSSSASSSSLQQLEQMVSPMNPYSSQSPRPPGGYSPRPMSPATSRPVQSPGGPRTPASPRPPRPTSTSSMQGMMGAEEEGQPLPGHMGTMRMPLGPQQQQHHMGTPPKRYEPHKGDAGPMSPLRHPGPGGDHQMFGGPPRPPFPASSTAEGPRGPQMMPGGNVYRPPYSQQPPSSYPTSTQAQSYPPPQNSTGMRMESLSATSRYPPGYGPSGYDPNPQGYMGGPRGAGPRPPRPMTPQQQVYNQNQMPGYPQSQAEGASSPWGEQYYPRTPSSMHHQAVPTSQATDDPSTSAGYTPGVPPGVPSRQELSSQSEYSGMKNSTQQQPSPVVVSSSSMTIPPSSQPQLPSSTGPGYGGPRGPPSITTPPLPPVSKPATSQAVGTRTSPVTSSSVTSTIPSELLQPPPEETIIPPQSKPLPLPEQDEEPTSSSEENSFHPGGQKPPQVKPLKDSEAEAASVLADTTTAPVSNEQPTSSTSPEPVVTSAKEAETKSTEPSKTIMEEDDPKKPPPPPGITEVEPLTTVPSPPKEVKNEAPLPTSTVGDLPAPKEEAKEEPRVTEGIEVPTAPAAAPATTAAAESQPSSTSIPVSSHEAQTPPPIVSSSYTATVSSTTPTTVTTSAHVPQQTMGPPPATTSGGPHLPPMAPAGPHGYPPRHGPHPMMQPPPHGYQGSPQAMNTPTSHPQGWGPPTTGYPGYHHPGYPQPPGYGPHPPPHMIPPQGAQMGSGPPFPPRYPPHPNQQAQYEIHHLQTQLSQLMAHQQQSPSPMNQQRINEIQERLKVLQYHHGPSMPHRAGGPQPNGPSVPGGGPYHQGPMGHMGPEGMPQLGPPDMTETESPLEGTPVTGKKSKAKKPAIPKEKKEKPPKEPKATKKATTKKKKGKDPVSQDKVSDGDSAEKETAGEMDAPQGEDVDEGSQDSKAGQDAPDSTTPSPQKAAKKPKVKAQDSKKKKLSKTILSFSKKRKRRGSDSEGGSDLDATPPPSPEEDTANKRRSARNTKRKKYVDDVAFEESLLLEDDDEKEKTGGSAKGGKAPATESAEGEKKAGAKAESGPSTSTAASRKGKEEESLIKPGFAYINTADEDSMIVQVILAVRKGKREVEDSDDEEEVLKTVVKEEAKEERGKEEGVASETTPNGTQVKSSGEGEAKGKEDETQADTTTKSEPEGTPPPPMANGEVDKKEGDAKKEEGTTGSPDKKSTTPVKPAKEPKMVEIDEYLVKYKNFSYIHCEWRTEEELAKGDKRIGPKIKRFSQKINSSNNMMAFLDEEPFNPDYTEVDRVLDVTEYEDPVTSQKTRHFLVKWRSLPYDEATWELEEDVDPNKIQQYMTFKDPPTGRKPMRRPKPDQWIELKESPVYKNNNTLRAYQLEALNWLTFSYCQGRNCILADEMGLGKTIQSIAYLQGVHNYGVTGPYLVVAPLSTIPNWQREFETWTDLNVIVYHGNAASRNMIQEYEMHYKDEKGEKIPSIYKFEALITTFEVVISDCLELREISWKSIVVDEAHRLKNKNCKLLEGLKLLNADHRVLLSGTPLQNNINELFSLLHFLEPTQFASQDVFMEDFGDLKSEEQVQKLQALLKPMMLRRLKGDVEKSIAPKEETIIEVELTNIQKKYYRAILERNFQFLSRGSSAANVPNLMNTMMELRKCCIHPYLLNGAEDQIQDDWKTEHGHDENAYYKAMIQSSGKLVLVDKLLAKLKSSGHRVLIFSQMVRCLDILEDYLIYRKYPFERIDGRIRGNLRQAAIDRYCKPDSDRFVFLLCTKAGGLGINLTAADTVIIYDSDWNPQNDLQAQARCHRIGQSKMVKVYRLICRNTYEREMFDRASLKLGLDKAVLQSMNTSQGGKVVDPSSSGSVSKKEVEELLRKGAYGALMDDENEGDKFCEEDIDQILERRTQVIQMTQDEGSSFSKASFAQSENRSDISIDDPDFWSKWAKKADIDEEVGKPQLIIKEPRRRTQVKRFGNDDLQLEVSELDSSEDSDEDSSRLKSLRKTRGSKQGRRRGGSYDEDFNANDAEVVYGDWNRTDCFRVEKGLLQFGWGRWPEILHFGGFRSGWKEADLEECSRLVLLYCAQMYRGDEEIRNFVFDLIAPASAEKVISSSHEGLSNPAPHRGRRSRKGRPPKDRDGMGDGTPPLTPLPKEGWAADEKYDCESILDPNFKKHLNRHANRILLRIRMLYYLKHEILGDLAEQITPDKPAEDIPLTVVPCDLAPTSWWDGECDKSLLIGTYKHGCERFDLIRTDPSLCFLRLCGPADANGNGGQKGSNAPSLKNDNEDTNDLPESAKEDEDGSRDAPRSTESGKKREDEEEKGDEAEEKNDKSDEDKAKEKDDTEETTKEDDKDKEKDDESKPEIPKVDLTALMPEEETDKGYYKFPSDADLNTRLRRLVTSYQRSYKREELRNQARAKRMERQERLDALAREREMRRMDIQQKKWSKKEQAEFQRVIAVFGVEFKSTEQRYDWTRFRQLAHLEGKYDDTLADYYRAFLAMLKRVVGRRLTPDDEMALMQYPIEFYRDEQAKRTLERIELLNKIREIYLPDPKLPAKLREICQPGGPEMPDWWKCGKHDIDLLKGAGRYGLAHMDYYILNDPELSFKDILFRFLAGKPLVEESVKTEMKKEQKDEVTITAENKEVKEEKESEKEIPEKEKDSESEKEALEKERKDDEEESKESKKEEPVPSEEEKKEKEDVPTGERQKRKTRSGGSGGLVSMPPRKRGRRKLLEKLEKEGDEEEEVDEKKSEENQERDNSVKEKSEKEEVGEHEEEEAEEKKEAEEENDDKLKVEEEEEEETPLSLTVRKKPEEATIREEDSVRIKKDPESELFSKSSSPAKTTMEEVLAKFSTSSPRSDSSALKPGVKASSSSSMLSVDSLGNSASILSMTYAPAIQWPKDKILVYRIEQIVTCLETGRWPPPPPASIVEMRPTPASTPGRESCSTPLSGLEDLAGSVDRPPSTSARSATPSSLPSASPFPSLMPQSASTPRADRDLSSSLAAKLSQSLVSSLTASSASTSSSSTSSATTTSLLQSQQAAAAAYLSQLGIDFPSLFSGTAVPSTDKRSGSSATAGSVSLELLTAAATAAASGSPSAAHQSRPRGKRGRRSLAEIEEEERQRKASMERGE
ncbi:unnamed protein product [Cyprideis torosa]|uniref:Uncharacterized protein n=1 Tax=Cyprideis torosa TaxID=163714 RepID=A0A7R8W690_9CRUS|nr:unnamed protein product [Cyprideis torosa]CAG0886234.1 unnamed protein product [Cyprideis torosa]